MQLELCLDPPAAAFTPSNSSLRANGPKVQRGRQAFQKGVLAELAVERLYHERNAKVIGRRVRTRGGEIDLILETKDEVIFVEVKARRSLEEAAHSVSRRQIDRIGTAALDWLEQQHRLQSAIRFDVALVDRYGTVEIRENALLFDG